MCEVWGMKIQVMNGFGERFKSRDYLIKLYRSPSVVLAILGTFFL
jgi:hypothetical protein